MRAVKVSKYGSPVDVAHLADVDRPSPSSNEVLVRIKSTTINDYDWVMSRGKPSVLRLFFGLKGPKNPILGMELAGVVEEIGEDVSDFKVGDAVYGDTSDFGFGTFAEFMAINEKALVKKSESISFDEAATIPHASMLAYEGLFDIANLSKNQRILINGAGGGVGTFALQLAKLSNAYVVGIDTGSKLDMMLDIGFDQVYDYKTTDIRKLNDTFDVVLDCKTAFSPFAYLSILKKTGCYVTVGGNYFKLLSVLFYGGIIKRFTGKHVKVLGLKTNKYLNEMNTLFDQKKIYSVIDGPYSLEETPKQIQRFGEGLHTGKIVIRVAD